MGASPKQMNHGKYLESPSPTFLPLQESLTQQLKHDPVASVLVRPLTGN